MVAPQLDGMFTIMRQRTRRSIVALVVLLAPLQVRLAAAAPADAPPAAPVYMVGDSLTFLAYQSLHDMYPQHGWTSSTITAGAGREVDFYVSSIDNEDGLGAVDHLRAEFGDVQDWVVELGTNDALYSDPSTYVNKVRSMLDRIGAGRQVMWVNVYLPGVPARQAAWNAALETVVAERHGDVTIFDWASVNAAHPEWMDPDLIHHTDAGSVAYATAITEASRMLLPAHRVDDEPAPSVGDGGAPSGFVPVAPKRLLDTRLGAGAVTAGVTTRIEVASFVPAGTTALAIDLAAVGARSDGYATAFHCGSGTPLTSTVNFTSTGAAQSTSSIVPVGGDGALCIVTSAAVDIVVDMFGAFVEGTGDGLRAAPPTRIHDSRSTGGADAVLATGTTTRLAVPGALSGAVSGAAVNLTVDNIGGAGFLTAWPCAADRPLVSNLNFVASDRQKAATTIVPLGTDGLLCVYNSAPTSLIVDLIATFSPSASAMFHATNPTRVLDTRDGLGGWAGRTATGQRLGVTTGGVPDGAVLTGTLTATDAAGAGYLIAWDGTGDLPTTSTLNYVHGSTRPNMLVVATVGGAFTAAQGPTGRADVIVDVTGWFGE